MAAGSAATLVAYGLIALTWSAWDLSYTTVYLAAGGVTLAAAVLAALVWPQIEAPHPQRQRLLLRRRYWLYYALQFMAGARRQVFVVFGGFMLVERYGLDVAHVTALFMLNLVANMILAPLIGRLVSRAGERLALVIEYAGLALVFVLYAGLYWFGWGVAVAAALYVVDNLFFAMAIAMRTYFQKIADPSDIAPTSAVSFTINHIAAVFLPAALGFLWLVSPAAVFVLGAALALVTVGLSALVPRHPAPGNETAFSRPRAVAPAAPAPYISAE
jgi:predicted MFS family arabinose efflux permease